MLTQGFAAMDANCYGINSWMFKAFHGLAAPNAGEPQQP